MPDTAYAPAQPDQTISTSQTTDDRPFYVVSKGKFLTLWILLFGMYQIYWAFKNWKQFQRATGQNLWPAPRALFSLFFTHSLYREADARLKRDGRGFQWNPRGLATLFVIFTLISMLVDVLSRSNIGFPIVDILSLGTLPVTGWIAWLGQRGLNAAAGDLEGRSNAQFTLGEYVLMAIGALFLVMACFGMTLPSE